MNSVRGFSATMTREQALELSTDPAVAYVEQDRTFKTTDTQTPTPSWGLDRIDQRDLPLNNSFTDPNTASAVTAYIIDTGIRVSHSDGNNSDCNGHGTHVAGTVGGAAHGVAKGVRLVTVKVLNCTGSGSTASVMAGIDWVTGQHQPGQPATANMSLGASGSDPAIESAVRNSISDGTCTDVFAPGSAITSAWATSDTATTTINGTSMATPHVAGAAALILAATPTPSPSPSGCNPAPNGTDVRIPDLATAESPITVAGCAGNASASTQIDVNIAHTYISDLVVSLIAPDGTAYVLHNRSGGSADNINQTYTVNLSSEPANGTWRLRAQDAAAFDSGFINSWTITP